MRIALPDGYLQTRATRLFCLPQWANGLRAHISDPTMWLRDLREHIAHPTMWPRNLRVHIVRPTMWPRNLRVHIARPKMWPRNLRVHIVHPTMWPRNLRIHIAQPYDVSPYTVRTQEPARSVYSFLAKASCLSYYCPNSTTNWFALHGPYC